MPVHETQNTLADLPAGKDFLDVSALCGGSIAAITTGAAAIGAFSGALHAGCRYNKLLKNSSPGRWSITA